MLIKIKSKVKRRRLSQRKAAAVQILSFFGFDVT
jgi:hypothetical protein